MSATYGKIFKITIFGESHSESIGVILDGIPSGLELDMDEILKEMQRRAPGKNSFSTTRAEGDVPEIQSGYFEGKTTGTPLCAIIKNTNTRSKDYAPDLLRPSHADYSGKVRYNGYNDYRGGGHFSGRLTATLVFAGAIAKQILKDYNVEILSHIKNIGKVYDSKLDYVNPDANKLRAIKYNTLPLLDETKYESMENEILTAKSEADSVGGSVEIVGLGIPAGVGSPFFDSVESRISQILFSVPAVKSVEFGIGIAFNEMCGSTANDPFILKDGKIATLTNNNGGINGGITNGMPIVVSAGIKPTPSIGKEQNTVNIDEMKEIKMSICGRHDPCIVQRAVPVIESAVAIAILDMILECKTY
ncbi:MAG: chorismate synthase [Clostridia bacterium]|nr:chorismate synthase [Clostridia bacterium]